MIPNESSNGSSNELLELVMKHCDITWLDTATQEKLSLSIDNAVAFLDGISGFENDYMQAGSAQTLLFAYVDYDRINAINDFKENYRKDIVAFINRAKVKKYIQKQEENNEQDDGNVQ